MAQQRPNCIDLFCGAGGLSEGFRQAGFHVLAGQDFNPIAGQTFSATHPEATFIGGPIQDIAAGDLLKASGLGVGELDVLVGGPPCQAYSVYNHQRGVHDERASLFKEYLRIVKGLQPKWIVMENVTGITSIAGGAVVREIKAELGFLGYRVDHQVLKAEEYGVPQERRRIFFIGTRTDAPISFPKPRHGEALQPFVTIWDAIGDLPKIGNGECGDGRVYGSEPQNAYQRALRGDSISVTCHAAPRLSKTNEMRMTYIPQGGSWRDIPHDLLPEGMKRAKRSDHTKRYGRMKPDGLSCTVLTKCDIHWGAFLHPFDSRAISVREAARLQSFPDWFVFAGARTDQYVQVGNAVPPLLGKCVAESILSAMDFACENPLPKNLRSSDEAANGDLLRLAV